MFPYLPIGGRADEREVVKLEKEDDAGPIVLCVHEGKLEQHFRNFPIYICMM